MRSTRFVYSTNNASIRFVTLHYTVVNYYSGLGKN